MNWFNWADTLGAFVAVFFVWTLCWVLGKQLARRVWAYREWGLLAWAFMALAFVGMEVAEYVYLFTEDVNHHAEIIGSWYYPYKLYGQFLHVAAWGLFLSYILGFGKAILLLGLGAVANTAFHWWVDFYGF